jgi:methylenetetrahydrofolate dehydrogenase (NADP+)/methenyltetrahydrofolate cyclohydrolase
MTEGEQMTTIIDGKAIAGSVRQRVAASVAEIVALGAPAPGLATILVGDDPASEVYVASKRRACAEAGIADHHRHLPGDIGQDELAAVIDELAADGRVSGILLQLPLPAHLDSGALIARIPASKDVDGLTAVSAGNLVLGRPGLRPCTPSGVIELLDAVGVVIQGADAVVVGRSVLVGKPVAQLLLERNATVTVAHSRTRDLAAVLRTADIVVAAAGVPGLVTAADIKPGAAVIDVGIHRTPAGLVGDVDFAGASEVAGWITPVPGGVGPMTIAMLLQNTVEAYRLQHA